VALPFVSQLEMSEFLQFRINRCHQVIEGTWLITLNGSKQINQIILR